MATADKSGRMPSILDREIRDRESDAFGHRHFAEALRSLVESDHHRPPYSIGLLGRWGTGKSTIKQLYIESLSDDAARNLAGRKRADRIRVITFNAWRFGGEDIKRSLLRHVFLELGGDRHSLQDALYLHIERVAAESRPWREIVRDILDRWVFSLLQILAPFALVIGLLILLSSVLRIESWTFALVFLGAMWALGYSLKHFFSSARFLVASTAPTKRIELPQTSAEQYEDLLIDQMASFRRDQGRGCERIVVFVDDLDRLSAEEMVTGLDAVRTFLEIPESQLPKGLGVVFVISCDEDRVAQAIAGKQRRFGGTDLPGSVFNLGDARRFLDRIFQFRLEIPSFPHRDMRTYAEAKLREDAPRIVASLEKRGVSIENVVDRMIHARVQSPRNAIQIVNAFIQSWWLAEKREYEGAGTDVAGGLAEHAVTGHALTLAALSALRVNFPDFFADLQEDPDLIRRVEAIAFRGASLEEQPTTTQATLRTYIEKNDFKESYRPLRQFLASLRGLRWPPSLQAHLQLAQDPWTRRLGDRAHQLYQAFVSGDTRGVLGEFGREFDTKQLEADDCRKLRDLEGELYLETPSRQNNAAFVLAELLPRIPESEAPSLMTPLTKRLADSVDLRSRVGVSRMRGILEYASPGDRRHVAETLIEDFCKAEGEIEFPLESGERQSLEEAIRMTREAVSIALWVRATDGLSEEPDQSLLSWLEVRRVAVSGKEQALPYADLEVWIRDHEESILADFTPRYLDLLAAQFEADDVESFEPDDALERAARLFRALHAKGEESRAILWTLLPRFASARDARAARRVTEFLLEHHVGVDVEALNATVLALAGRADKRLGAPDKWDLPEQYVEQALVNITEQRCSELDAETGEGLVSLAKQWATSGEFAGLATSMARALARENAHGDLLAFWGNQILTDLSIPCAEFIAAEFASLLEDQERQVVVNALSPVVSADNIPKEQGERYRAFMKAVGPEGSRSEELQSHLASLLPVVAQRHANPSGYLFRVFPVIPPKIPFCPPGPLGDMLQSLFVQTRGNAELFGWLHEWMVDHWPRQTDETNSYKPETLFSQGVEFLNQQPQSEHAGGVLTSLSSMLHMGVVSGREQEVVDMACRLWPIHRDAAKRTLTAHAVAPSPELTAALADASELGDSEDVERLKEAWAGVVEASDEGDKKEVALNILKSEAKETSDSPDVALDLWLDAQPEGANGLLAAVLGDDGITDLQRARAWKSAERRAASLGSQFFADVIPPLFAIEDGAATTAAVLDSRSSLAAAFEQADDRHGLSTALIRALLTSDSVDAKNRLAQWLRDLGAQAVVRDLGNLGEPTEDDVESLLRAFPELKRRLRKLVTDS